MDLRNATPEQKKQIEEMLRSKREEMILDVQSQPIDFWYSQDDDPNLGDVIKFYNRFGAEARGSVVALVSDGWVVIEFDSDFYPVASEWKTWSTTLGEGDLEKLGLKGKS